MSQVDLRVADRLDRLRAAPATSTVELEVSGLRCPATGQLDPDRAEALLIGDREHGANATKGINDRSTGGVLQQESRDGPTNVHAHRPGPRHLTQGWKDVRARLGGFQAEASREAEEVGVGRASKTDGARCRPTHDLVPEEVTPGAFGTDGDQVALIDPTTVVFDVGLKEDRDRLIRDLSTGELGGRCKPLLPTVDAELGELGVIGH